MPKGYWIARVDVHDPEAYKAYIEANGEAFAKFGARILVRGGAFECVDGSARERNVVLEFPSIETAKACWHSPEYQRALAFRRPVSTGDVIIVEGYDGPQPGDAA